MHTLRGKDGFFRGGGTENQGVRMTPYCPPRRIPAQFLKGPRGKCNEIKAGAEEEWLSSKPRGDRTEEEWLSLKPRGDRTAAAFLPGLP